MVDTVIDVSHYQAGLKLAPFKAAGGLAVIAKASQGTTSADPSFADFRAQAAAIPLAFASYHYLTNTDAQAQADWFLKCAAPAQGERIICDWEVSDVTAAMVVDFLDAVFIARPDLELTVYAGAAAKSPVIDAASSAWLKQNTSLWLAQYTSGTPSWPTATWKTWSLWQYTDSGSVPGYVGPVDGSKFNGSNSNLLKWFGPGVPPIPAPIPAPLATVTMTLVSDVPFTLIVNGQRIDLPGATS
jgi:lysozyme